MLQSELQAQQSYCLSASYTIPFFSTSSDLSPTKLDRIAPYRTNPPHPPSDADIVVSRSRSLPQPKSPPTKRLRKRGLVLTEQGWQKLLQAEVLHNQFGERYTFTELSEQTLLDPRTISRIISREEAVDKSSLRIFFDAFGLRLETEHYTLPKVDRDTGREQKDAGVFPDFATPRAEEIATIRQRIMEDCCLLTRLVGLEGIGQITVSVTLEPQAQPQLKLRIQQWC